MFQRSLQRTNWTRTVQTNKDQDYIPKIDWTGAQFWAEQLAPQNNQMPPTEALPDLIWNLKETRATFPEFLKELRNLGLFSVII